MKHLIAMLFYNITIGSSVMNHRHHKYFMIEANQNTPRANLISARMNNKQYRAIVVDIHCTLFKRSGIRFSNLFGLGISVQYGENDRPTTMGINAVKLIDRRLL